MSHITGGGGCQVTSRASSPSRWAYGSRGRVASGPRSSIFIAQRRSGGGRARCGARSIAGVGLRHRCRGSGRGTKGDRCTCAASGRGAVRPRATSSTSRRRHRSKSAWSGHDLARRPRLRERDEDLQAILDAIEARTLGARVAVVISERGRCQAPSRAPRGRAAFPRSSSTIRRSRGSSRLRSSCRRRAPAQGSVEYVVLAGFMRLITPVLLGAFPMRIVNVHPALLPAFPGVHAQGRGPSGTGLAPSRAAPCTSSTVGPTPGPSSRRRRCRSSREDDLPMRPCSSASFRPSTRLLPMGAPVGCAEGAGACGAGAGGEGRAAACTRSTGIPRDACSASR